MEERWDMAELIFSFSLKLVEPFTDCHYKKGIYMIYYYKQHEVRKYLRRNKSTKKEEVVSVSNVNNLSVEEHMELLNLNDENYEYIAYLGTVYIES